MDRLVEEPATALIQIDTELSQCIAASDETIRLSVDILRKMFDWLALMDRPSQGHLGWITASHVCSRWRQVLLDMPLLWADIVCAFSTKDAFVSLVMRAQDVAVALDTGSNNRFPSWAYEWALNDTRRIRTFVYPVIDRGGTPTINRSVNFDDSFPLLLEQEWPHLQELHLGSIDYSDYTCLSADSPASLEAPSLRSLTLDQINIPVHAPRLTTLRLWGVVHPAIGTNPNDLFLTLRSCPMLEHLELRNTILLSDQAWHGTRYRLQSLRRLILIMDSADIVHALLRMMDTPALQSMYMRVHYSVRILDVLQEMRQFLSCPQYDTLRVHCSTTDRTRHGIFESCIARQNVFESFPLPRALESYPLARTGRYLVPRRGLNLFISPYGSRKSEMARLSTRTAMSMIEQAACNICHVHLLIEARACFLTDEAHSIAPVLALCQNVYTLEIAINDFTIFTTVGTILNPANSNYLLRRLETITFKVVPPFNRSDHRWSKDSGNGKSLYEFFDKRRRAGIPISDLQFVSEDQDFRAGQKLASFRERSWNTWESSFRSSCREPHFSSERVREALT